MKFGFVGSYGNSDQILEMAVEAERCGWDGFFTWDGISIGEVDTFDPWSLLGAIAVRTARIKIGAIVFALARRNPWEVARASVTIDRLSGGRLIMPVGLGAVEDAGFSRVSGGATQARIRAERLDDALAILDRAWTGEPFSYQGKHYSVEDIVFQPTPVQQPRIPVWAVGLWPAPRSLNRAIAWDGILPQVRGHAIDEPTTAAELAEIATWIAANRQTAHPFEIVVEGVLPIDAATAAAHAQELAAAGATWWIESRWDTQRDTPEVLLDRIRQGPPQRPAPLATT